MNLDLTKEEMQNLIEMLQMAEWMMNAHKTEPDPATKKYSVVEQKVYAAAKEAGYGDLLAFNKETNATEASDKLVANALEIIDEYDNDTFWHELVHRVVMRDLIKQMGEEKYDKLTVEERIAKEEPLMEKYSAEFEQNDLKNLILKGSDLH